MLFQANKIKANSKSAVIIRQLLELFPDGVPCVLLFDVVLLPHVDSCHSIENEDTPTQPGPLRTTRSRRRYTPFPSTQPPTSRTTRSKRSPPPRQTPTLPSQTAPGDIAEPLSLGDAAPQQPENNHGPNPTTPLVRLGRLDADASTSPPPSTRSFGAFYLTHPWFTFLFCHVCSHTPYTARSFEDYPLETTIHSDSLDDATYLSNDSLEATTPTSTHPSITTSNSLRRDRWAVVDGR